MTRRQPLPSPPYGRARPWRPSVIYGVAVDERTGKHHCFNRDYEILPVQLPPFLLEALMQRATAVQERTIHGHGFYRFLGPKQAEHATTYFLYCDGNKPRYLAWHPKHPYDVNKAHLRGEGCK